MLVNFISNHKSIIFQGQFSDSHQFFPGEHFSTGVGGIADDNGFCSLFESFFHQIDIKLVFRRDQRNIDGFCSGQNRIRSVIFIKGENTITLSPGLQIVIIAHIMASVPPQVTTISVSGQWLFQWLFLFSGKSFSEVLSSKRSLNTGEGLYRRPGPGHP